MSDIYIFGSGYKAQLILTWLTGHGDLSRDHISGIIDYPEFLNDVDTEILGVPVTSYNDIKGRLCTNDIFIIVSRLFNEAIAELFSQNFYNVFDGEAVIQRENKIQKFLNIASDLYIGPFPPKTCEAEHHNYLRYIAKPLEANKVPMHKLFIVNSMPKSGTVWMMAMLERVLGVRANQQITLSHLRDIEVDWPKPNNHGAVVLVRDMRDVVVSWFHHLSRVDLQNGFSSPRYPNVEDFYFEHFIGQLFGSSRYYFGELEKWLDFVGANSFPVIKYEDLVSDTPASLRKVMNFWKISIPDQALFDIAQEHSFGNMQKNFFDQDGFVADMLKTGHLRSGRVGAWEEEMPTRVAEDINRRFFGYQRRLQYL